MRETSLPRSLSRLLYSSYGYFSELGAGNELELKALEAIALRRAWIEPSPSGGIVVWPERIEIKEDVLFLSATPEPAALKSFLLPQKQEGVEVVEARVAGLEKALRIHIARAYGKRSSRFDRYIPSLTEAFQVLKRAGKKRLKVFSLGHKQKKKALAGVVRQAARKARVQVQIVFEPLHHFNARGSNLVEACDAIVIWGVPAVNPRDAWDLATVFLEEEAEAVRYVEELARREVYQEAHRLRLTRARWGEKVLVFVGSNWPFEVPAEVIISQNGRPKKGTSYSPVRVDLNETFCPVIHPLLVWRKYLASCARFLALPPSPLLEGEEERESAHKTEPSRGPPGRGGLGKGFDGGRSDDLRASP